MLKNNLLGGAMREFSLFRVFLLLKIGFALAVGATFATNATYLVNRGYSFSQMGWLVIIFCGTFMLAEIPTGIFADKFGRKKAFVCSLVLFGISQFVCLVADSFLWFALAYAIEGIAVALNSGAFCSWYIDALASRGEHSLQDKYISHEPIIHQVVSTLSALIGSALFQLLDTAPFIFSGSVAFCTAIIAVVIMRDSHPQKAGREEERLLGIAPAIRAMLTNPVLVLVGSLSFVQFFGFQGLSHFWLPYLQKFFTSQTQAGLMLVVVGFCMAFGSYVSQRLVMMSGNTRMRLGFLLFGQLVIGAAIFGMLFTGSATLVFFSWFLSSVGWGMLEPLRVGIYNRIFDAEQRATMNSIAATPIHVGRFLGIYASSFLADAYGLGTAWAVSGAILVVVVVLAVPVILKLK